MNPHPVAVVHTPISRFMRTLRLTTSYRSRDYIRPDHCSAVAQWTALWTLNKDNPVKYVFTQHCSSSCRCINEYLFIDRQSVRLHRSASESSSDIKLSVMSTLWERWSRGRASDCQSSGRGFNPTCRCFET